MADLTALDALLERLEKAIGPDRELDVKIFKAFKVPVPDAFINQNVNLQWNEERQAFVYLVPNTDLQVRYDPPAYTASIDAAVSFAERVLPGWGFFLRKDQDGCNVGMLYPDASSVTPGAHRHAEAARSLCIAIVRAVKAQRSETSVQLDSPSGEKE